MSYRLEINDVQVFGNNEIPMELINFLKDNGVTVSEEFWFDHTFEPGQIDVMAMFDCIERYYTNARLEEIERTKPFKNELKSWFDFKSRGYEAVMDCEDDLKEPLIDIVMRLVSSEPLFGVARCIVPLLYSHTIEYTEPYADKKHLHCYKQCKPIHVRGW